MPENINFYSKEEQETQLAELTNGFRGFVREGKYSADEIREAYYALCGVSENESESPRVGEILSKMKEMDEQGYPINRFAQSIGEKQELEDSVNNFNAMVDSMNISEREKSVLRSLLKEKRVGRVEFIVNGEVFSNFHMTFIRGKDSVPEEILALALINALQKTMARIPPKSKLEISFEED